MRKRVVIISLSFVFIFFFLVILLFLGISLKLLVIPFVLMILLVFIGLRFPFSIYWIMTSIVIICASFYLIYRIGFYVDTLAIIVSNRDSKVCKIEFGCNNEKSLTLVDGMLIAIIPESGILKTSTNVRDKLPYNIFLRRDSSIGDEIDPEDIIDIGESIRQVNFDFEGRDCECKKCIKFEVVNKNEK